MDSYQVQTASYMQEVTKQALELAGADLRAIIREDMTRKLAEYTRDAIWVEPASFDEYETIRSYPIYADDANWDDGEPEPVEYRSVEVVLFRGWAKFAKKES